MPIAENNSRVTRYPPLGHCMYCGSTRSLSREHIIPFGLGGNLIFADASCSECAKITSDFERYCLRNIFQAARTHLEMPTRKKAERPKKLRLSYFKNEGDHEWLEVPVSDHPYAVVLPVFQPPTLISNKELSDGFMLEGTILRPGPDFFEKLNQFGPNHAFTQMFSPDLFARLLAKIAHGFAIAELGEHSFMPLLQGVILGTMPFISAFVGGGPPQPARGLLHQLSLDWHGCYLVCSINLFSMGDADPATPLDSTHDVIVGLRT